MRSKLSVTRRLDLHIFVSFHTQRLRMMPERKENTMPFGINLMRSPVLYRAAHAYDAIAVRVYRSFCADLSLLQDSAVPGRSTLNEDLQMDSADMPVCLQKPFGPQRDMKRSASGLPRQVVHPVSEHSTLLSAKYQMPCLRLHMMGTCIDE